MVDACAGGTLNSLTYKEVVKKSPTEPIMMSNNPFGEIESKKCMLFISPELMPALRKLGRERYINQVIY
jgi:hypothetical protein